MLKNIRKNVQKEECAKGLNFVILTGGHRTFSQDVTPEALRPLLERLVPGIEEAIGAYVFPAVMHILLVLAAFRYD